MIFINLKLFIIGCGLERTKIRRERKITFQESFHISGCEGKSEKIHASNVFCPTDLERILSCLKTNRILDYHA
jgi:hypothetical protein